MKILRAGTLIDGTGAPPVRDAAVVIHNGRIETVTTAGASAGPPTDHEGLIPGPRLVLSLGIISPIGGIGDRVSPSGHASPFLQDPSLPPSVAQGIEGVRTTVRAMVRAGAGVIKCATTGGASSRAGHGPKDAAFNADEMRALVDEAHALGRRVMCHAVGGPGLRRAIEAGVDSIE